MNLDRILSKTKDISVATARFEHGFYYATELIFLAMIIILLLYRRLALEMYMYAQVSQGKPS